MYTLRAHQGPMVRSVYCNFRQAQRGILQAPTGAGKTVMALQIAYDCLFMDCQMPDMDGYAATALIRQREVQTGQRVPIIALTASAMSSDRERCLAAGMDDYLSKPAQAQDLVTMLRKWTSCLAPALVH